MKGLASFHWLQKAFHIKPRQGCFYQCHINGICTYKECEWRYRNDEKTLIASLFSVIKAYKIFCLDPWGLQFIGLQYTMIRLSFYIR
jgi:hypothetical protein